MARDKVEAPAAVIRVRDRVTGIRIFRGTKFSYVVMLKSGIRVVKISNETLYQDWSTLHQHKDGQPDPERVYKVQEAARKFLDWGTNAGITEVAERALKSIVNGKGVTEMNEAAVSKQPDIAPKPGPTPSTAKVDKALATAKKASTKNGTTPAAKAPGKVTPTKPAAKGKKDAPKGKTPAKPEPKGKKASPKENGAKGGRPSALDKSKKIKVVEKDNPRREGTAVWENYELIKKYDGKTVEQFAANKNALMDSLAKEVKLGRVKLV